MKVLLLQNIKNVGQKGDIKDVAEGFARNNLIPRGLVKECTEKVMREVQKLSKDKDTHNFTIQEKIKEEFELLSNKTFSFNLKSNEKGMLFGKFDVKDILEKIHKEGYKHIDKKHISDSIFPIKQTGEYTIVLKDGKTTSTFTLEIK